MLRHFIRQFKPSGTEPVVRFETAPGQQLQIDFTTIPHGKRCLKAFVATLGYSRACYVKFFSHERTVAWQQGLIEAFGGVPKEVLCDNARHSSLSTMRKAKVVISTILSSSHWPKTTAIVLNLVGHIAPKPKAGLSDLITI